MRANIAFLLAHHNASPAHEIGRSAFDSTRISRKKLKLSFNERAQLYKRAVYAQTMVSATNPPPIMKPALFIASSSESVGVAYALQENLEHVTEVTVWSQGVFDLSRFTLESLLDALDAADFGIFVFSPDDALSIRGQNKQAVRDNVVFELGIFIGRLGRERNFIVIPKGNEDGFRLPTDLLGLTPALYEPNRQDANLQASLGPASSKIMKAISKLGPRGPSISESSLQPAAQIEVLNYSDADRRAILESWMGSRSRSENASVIHFAEVDRQLRLPLGSTKSLIKSVATRWNYVVQHEGEHTILFREDVHPIRRSSHWSSY